RRRRRDAVEAEMLWRSEQDRAEPEADLLERLYAAIRQLPPVERSLILLSLDGMSYAQIAQLHGLTETNVGARLTRIRQRVSSLVEEADDGV
ncbi:MAG TPA: sigma-70 region 4 domain-containing protein, partial [Caulobacter sp.]|nr:sigma-70 region 4 domain-containing protein [Caulobacter sp.]